MRVCHPEPVSFAGEGFAVVRKSMKKQIPHPVQKPNGVRNDIFSSFSAGLLGFQRQERRVRRRTRLRSGQTSKIYLYAGWDNVQAEYAR